MTKPKKKSGPEVLPSRALEHGERAFGARFKRPGFALKPELDLAFALGHGSVAFGPVRLLSDLALGKKAKASYTEVHRNVAIAALRAGPEGFGKPIVHQENPAPIDEPEAQKLIRARLPKLGVSPIYFRALEAMVGPACVLPAYVDGVEAINAGAWDTGRLNTVFPVLYGLLLRAPVEQSNTARGRLEALLEQRDETHAAANLDMLLNGKKGIARRGYKYSVKFKSFQRNDSADPSNVLDLCYCDGEQDFVAAQFQALWEALNWKVMAHMSGPSPARLFFLGGEKTLETELRVVDRYPGTKQAEALASYSELRSPLAVQLVQRLTGLKSKVKAQAEAWLEAHG